MQTRSEIILNQFAASWTETERYFKDLITNYSGFERLKPISQFILDLKERGKIAVSVSVHPFTCY